MICTNTVAVKRHAPYRLTNHYVAVAAKFQTSSLQKYDVQEIWDR